MKQCFLSILVDLHHEKRHMRDFSYMKTDPKTNPYLTSTKCNVSAFILKINNPFPSEMIQPGVVLFTECLIQ